MPATLSLKGYTGKRIKGSKKPSFADWLVQNAAICILSFGLNADVVAWIVSVMQSNGEMQGIENISTLEKVLKNRRPKFSFHAESEWDLVILAARVLIRAWEKKMGDPK